MIKDITGRQAIILVAIVMCATKFFILPSNLLAVGGQNVVYVMIFFFVIEFLLLLVLVRISMLHPDKTFYTLLQESIGTFFAKFVHLLFFAFFIVKILINIVETYTFFLGTLYDEFSPLLFTIPLLFLIFYMTYIGLRSIGRCSELLWVFVLAGLSISFFTALPNVDLSYMLPIFENGPSDALTALSKNIMWFGDYFVYLFFMGKIRFKENYFRNIALTTLIVFLAVVVFIMVIHCLFPYTASLIHYGVSDITQTNTRVTNVGKLDWLNVTVWTFACLIQTVIFSHCAEECLSKVFNIKSKATSCLVSLVFVVVGLYLLQFNLVTLIHIAQSPLRFLFWILLFVVFNIATLHFVLRFRKRKRKKVVLND